MTNQFSFLDQCINTFDVALRSICIPENRQTQRANPADGIAESSLTESEKAQVIGLMRINHAGEVCAQALYQGQGLTADLSHVRQQMQESAVEEVDHLAWCEKRLVELGAAPGILNPVWYTGAFFIGLIAGWIGDQWSLGFVAETEKQVTEHLQQHLDKLPAKDTKTKAILQQMQIDEQAHAQTAENAGARALPWVIKRMMRHSAKLMTTLNYYV